MSGTRSHKPRKCVGKTRTVLKNVVFVEGDLLCIDGDVNGAVSAWLKYLQHVPGMLLCFSRLSTALLFLFTCVVDRQVIVCPFVRCCSLAEMQ